MKGIYTKSILIIAHTILLLVVLNGVASWWITRGQEEDNTLMEVAEVLNFKALETDKPACKLDSIEVIDALDAFIEFKKKDSAEFAYHPATEYQLNNFALPNLTTYQHESGFNIRANAKDEPKQARSTQVFCFGGSTTYGTFVKDHQTWPAYLEELLDSVAVLNFGVPGFVPTQETNQFIYLLKLGYRPQVAIFMDGVNIGPIYDGSDFTRNIAQRFGQQEEYNVWNQLALIQWLKGSYKKEIDFFESPNEDLVPLGESSDYNDYITQRFIQNAKLRQVVGEAYGVEVIQFLQPNAQYDYDAAKFSEAIQGYMQSDWAKEQAANLSIIFKDVLEADAGYKDLQGLFESYGKPATLDIVHYTPAFNQYLATNLLELVQDSSVANMQGVKTTGTGLPFNP